MHDCATWVHSGYWRLSAFPNLCVAMNLTADFTANRFPIQLLCNGVALFPLRTGPPNQHQLLLLWFHYVPAIVAGVSTSMFAV